MISDQWAWATPCQEWNSTQLVEHVIATHRRVPGLLHPAGSDDETESGDLLDGWVRVTGVVQDAQRDLATAGSLVKARNTEQPFAALDGGPLTIDTLCPPSTISDLMAYGTAHHLEF